MVQLSRREMRFWALAGLSLVTALTLLVLGRAPATTAQGPELTANVVGFSADGWPSPQAVLTVQDAEGRSISGLATTDFVAQIDGAPVSLTSVTRAVDGSLPIAVVLALDTSGSMQGVALDQAKASAHSFLDGLGSADSIALVTFGTTVNTVLPLTTDRAAAAAAIDGLVADGTTSLYEATAESVRVASSGQNARRAVVLLSDGGLGVLSGAATREEAIAAVQTGGVPVFAIGLGADLDRAYLHELTAASGGRFAETPSPEGLAQLYQDVAELLRGQYVLTLDVSGIALERSQAATLRVDVTANGLAGSDERLVCPQAVCVSLGDLQDGARLETASTITAEVIAQDAVTSVAFLIDGQTVQEASSPPYQLTLDPSAYSGGGHTLGVQVTGAGGTTETKEVSLQLGAAGDSGFAMNPIFFVIGALMFVVVAGLGWFVLRRGSDREPRPSPAPSPTWPKQPPAAAAPEPKSLWDGDQPLVPQTAVDEPAGALLAVGGPLDGRTYVVGSTPTSIGSAVRCQIRLDEGADGAEIPPEYARVWVREGKLMVHELKRLTAFGAVGGRWEILGPNDMFSVGPYTFQFELAEDETATDNVPQSPYANGEAPTAAAVQQDAFAPAPPEQQHAPLPNASPPAATEAIETAPAVPNVLRDRPPAGEDLGAPPAPVEQIFRDDPPAPASASSEAADAVPNVLRDRPEPPANGATQPADDDLEPPVGADGIQGQPEPSYPELPLG